MSRTVVSLSGFRELNKALAELPRATAKAVLVRTLRKAGEPIAEEARQLVPVAQGELKASIAVSARIKNKFGKSEFASVLRGGGSKAEAVQALRDARRDAGGSFAEMYVGPASLPQAHMQEFGTSRLPPQPYMRPAWDSRQREALAIVKAEMGNEIIQAARRLAKSKRKTADVKYRASLAAMMAVEQGYTG